MKDFKTLPQNVQQEIFFYILPTLLVFTRGKDTESFITASALKVSVPASGRHAYGIELSLPPCHHCER